MLAMKLSLRRKIILTFALFLVAGVAIWSTNYYKHRLLTRKLQILEKKTDLFNTILEARRYEKNYFLSLELGSLLEAKSYVRLAEKKLSSIISNYGQYTLAKNLKQKLDELQDYENSLSSFLGYYEGSHLKVDQRLLDTFPDRQKEVRRLGRLITVEMEEILAEERQYVNRLANESRLYHMAALGGILLLSILTSVYLVFNVNRPLKAIEEAIHKISRGDYDNIPALSTGDEFESLVTNLNRMIEELNRRGEQLVQSEKMASLGTLTSGVAHELNNPLNNISTSVQILLEELEDGDKEYKRQLLLDAEEQIERERDIVKALLEFSRETSFNLQKVHFRDLVEQTVQLIKSEVPANVELKVDVPDGIRAKIDSRRIQQVLINLVLNAIQAMEDGGELDIEASEADGKGEFSFKVKDSGKGISPQDVQKIFDPFFTTKDVGKGSGLGLSVSHGIVRQHGGRIEVESEPGKGTTFTVHLPISDISA
jgi:two-component system NtrC family sensor kinase